MARSRTDGKDARAFLTTLARDVRGNAAMIMTASLIPLIGMVGGGVDLSRLYIVKTRLQHACDAGALAGRKMMGGGTWSSNTYAARTEAERFFDANFNANAYGTTLETAAQRRTFTESAGKVTGTVRAVVPMTLMRVFGRTSETINVVCDAEMRLPNTDVMFVLDTTKSMICAPSASTMYCSDAGSNSRMAGLRVAVKCFYQIVARLDVTDVDCEGDEPSGGTGNQVQIRFGFMPYATNVNVGKLLPNSYFVDSAYYQTRQANMATSFTNEYWQTYGSSVSQANCLNYMKNLAFTGFTPTATSSGGPLPATPTVATTFPHDGTATDGGSGGEWGWTGAPDTNSSGGKSCRRIRRDVTTYGAPRFSSWNYDRLPVTVSGLKAGGSTWNASFNAAVGDTAVAAASVTSSTITWDGCIEERDTVKTTDYDPIPSGAKDLDVDLVPNSDATRWRPALPRLIFTRGATDGTNYNGSSWAGMDTSGWNNTAENNSGNDYNNASAYSCPSEARKLAAWTDASVFQSYVNGLDPDGATYHDIGMLWGARFMSPTGIFSSDNATAPNGGEIERHMIFMTDGDTNANDYDYAAYGLPFYDRRQTAGAPTKAQLDEQVNNRFLAICDWIKNKNITLWVVSFGAAVNEASQDRLEQCATDADHFFSPDESDDLQSDFKSIADKISQLRLTR